MTSMPSFRDYVALMYHEARNVRHLIHEGHFSGEGWEKITSLPKNRDAAWRKVDHFTASLPNDASAVLGGFRKRFGKSLDELIDMFQNENWRHAKQYGGNAWARIGRKVGDLAEALIAGKIDDAALIERDLQAESHNTGTVKSKLRKLRSSIHENGT